jgi:hypothetical protein
MAITKTTSVQRVEVYPQSDADAADTLNSGNPTVMVVYEDAMDDPDDNDLPVVATRVKHLQRYTITINDDQTETSAATDVTGEDQLVQDICGAIWS